MDILVFIIALLGSFSWIPLWLGVLGLPLSLFNLFRKNVQEPFMLKIMMVVIPLVLIVFGYGFASFAAWLVVWNISRGL